MVALSKEEKIEKLELLKQGKKRCNGKKGCGKIKELSEFSTRGKLKDGSPIYRSICKECHNLSIIGKSSLEKRKLFENGKKYCCGENGCGKIKQLSEFSTRGNAKDGSIKYSSMCKECKNKQNRKELTKEQKEKITDKRELLQNGKKQCSGKYSCGEIKNLDEFYIVKRGKSISVRYDNLCKECRCKRKMKKSIIEQRELLKQGKKRCLGKGSCGEIKKLDEFSTRGVLQDGSLCYNNLCRECSNKNSRELRNKKIEEYRSKKNKRHKKRMESDPYYSFVHNARGRVSSELSKLGINYTGKTKIFGIESDEFFKYYDSLLQEGMTWENKGNVWHFDHILPVALFDWRDEKQYKICNHYTNLRPTFSEDNFSKSSIYDGIRYFLTKPPVIVDRDIAPKEIVEAIERGDKVDFWTYYGKLPEYQERLKIILSK